MLVEELNGFSGDQASVGGKGIIGCFIKFIVLLFRKDIVLLIRLKERRGSPP